jgi:hypothetical protein
MYRITLVLAILAFGILITPKSVSGLGIYGAEWVQIDLACSSGPTQTTPCGAGIPGCTVSFESVTSGSGFTPYQNDNVNCSVCAYEQPACPMVDYARAAEDCTP